MDPNTIISALSMLMVADNSSIQKGTEILVELSKHSSFLSSLVQITTNPQVDMQLRVGAVCCLNENCKSRYFKKETEKKDENLSQMNPTQISDSEKRDLLPKLIPAISLCWEHGPLWETLEEVLFRAISVDFPEKWSSLAQDIVTIISAADASAETYFGGLVAARALCGVYEFIVDGPEKDGPGEKAFFSREVLPTLFEALQGLTQKLLAAGTGMPVFSVLLTIVLECYETTFQLYLDEYFKGDILDKWMNIVLACLNRDISSPLKLAALTEEKRVQDQVDENPEFKLKRIALRLLGKLYTYCNSVISYRRKNVLKEITTQLIQTYSLQFLDVAAKMLQANSTALKGKDSAGALALPPMVLYFLLQFFNQILNITFCVEKLNPFLESLMIETASLYTQVGKEELSLFKYEPKQWILENLGPHDSPKSTVRAALSLVSSLCKLSLKGQKSPLSSCLVKFIVESLQSERLRLPGREGQEVFEEGLSEGRAEGLLHVLESVHETVGEESSEESLLTTFFSSTLSSSLSSSSSALLLFRTLSLFPLYSHLPCLGDNSPLCETLFKACSTYLEEKYSLPLRYKALLCLPICLPPSPTPLPSLSSLLHHSLNIYSLSECMESAQALEGVVRLVRDRMEGGDVIKVVQGMGRVWAQDRENQGEREGEVVKGAEGCQGGDGEEERGDVEAEKREMCLQSVATVLKAVELDEKYFSVLTELILPVFLKSIEIQEVLSLEKSLQILGILMLKCKKKDQNIESIFKVVAKGLSGHWGTKYTLESDAEMSSLPPEVSQALSAELSLDLEPLSSFLLGGCAVLPREPLWGALFLDVLNRQPHSPWEAGAGLKILTALLETGWEETLQVSQVLQAAQTLVGEDMSGYVLRGFVTLFSTLLWKTPQQLVQELQARNRLEVLFGVWVKNLPTMTSSLQKSRIMLAIGSLLQLPSEALPPVDSILLDFQL